MRAYESLQGQIEHLGEIPKAPDNGNVNYKLAALVAHIELGKRLIFSEQKIESYRDSLYAVWESQNAKEFRVSEEYGMKVAGYIGEWMDGDNYNQTRTMVQIQG